MSPDVELVGNSPCLLCGGWCTTELSRRYVHSWKIISIPYTARKARAYRLRPIGSRIQFVRTMSYTRTETNQTFLPCLSAALTRRAAYNKGLNPVNITQTNIAWPPKSNSHSPWTLPDTRTSDRFLDSFTESLALIPLFIKDAFARTLTYCQIIHHHKMAFCAENRFAAFTINC